MSEWHKVERTDIQRVMQWLEPFLPHAWKIFGTLRETMAGRWKGQSVYTLGWPEIRGVVEGETEMGHPCSNFIDDLKYTSLFAPQNQDIETILRSRFIDWTQRTVLMGVDDQTLSLVENIAKDIGLQLAQHTLHILMAQPGDIRPIPVPNEYRIRKLDMTTDLDHCVQMWKQSRPHTDQYVEALSTHLPNVCVVDRDDKCISFELGTEYGCMGMLHTREEYRGQGLAKVAVSHLAQEYFRDNLPCVTCVKHDNAPSLALNLAVGFKDTNTTISVIISRPP